jgi:hypothetical protein
LAGEVLLIKDPGHFAIDSGRLYVVTAAVVDDREGFEGEVFSVTLARESSCQIGAPVNDEAVDRILATIDLAGTTVLLPGIDVRKLDAPTTAAIKRARWGGSVRSMLSFLTATVHLRKLSTQEARKELAKLARAFVYTKDPANKVALALAKMALEQSQAKRIDARAWTNERIAGEFLPQHIGCSRRSRR